MSHKGNYAVRPTLAGAHSSKKDDADAALELKTIRRNKYKLFGALCVHPAFTQLI